MYPWMTPTTQHNTTPTKVNHQSSSQDGEACTNDGFMGDSENCRKFYRCVGNQRGGFIKYEFSCSESTIWDEDTQSCNHPWAVQRRRCGRGNSDSNNPSTSVAPLPNNKEKPTIQQQTQISFGSEVSQSQIQIAKEPVNQNQVQISFGDRVNEKENVGGAKQNQTQINFGSAVSQTQTQINYGNKVIQTQAQVDHTKSSSQTQTQVYKTTTAKPTTSILQEPDDPGYGIQPNTEGSTNNQDNENICTESGFMGDKNDCKKFYRCVDNGKGSYTKYEFSCGEGTVWDSSLEACNHAWAVKECGGKAPATTQTTPPETTTIKSTQSYYTTSHSTTVEESEDISYGNQSQEPPKTSTTTSTTTSQMPMTTGASISNDTVCSSSGFMGDVKDCKKFYRCVDNGGGSYTKYEFNCGEGTVWDPKIDACNHPWAVEKCGGSSSDINKVESTTTMKTTVITTVSFIHTTTQASTQNNDYEIGYGQQNNEFPPTTTTKKPLNQQEYEDNKCHSSGFMGDKYDCKKFYRCVDSGNGAYIRYEFSCGEGTVWDPQIEACNHAWAVDKCGGSDSTGDIQKETTPRPTQTLSDEELNTGYTTENQKETERTSDNSIASSTTATGTTNINNSECKTSGFIGDKNDCKKFYRCVDNGKGSFTRYEFSCGEGTVWDQSVEACNHAWMVENCGRTDNSSASAQIENTTPYHSTTTEIEDINSGYGSSSSEKTSTSALIESNHESSGDICSKEGFIGDRKDCKKFYRCVDNGRGGFIKYEFTCGEGTVWDSEINACNHPTPDRQCGVIGTEYTSQIPVHESDEPVTETAAVSVSTSTEHSQSSETSQKPLPSDATCKSEGFYGNPNNCKKFYRCVDNGKGGYTRYDFDCGDGTVWDPEIQSCNYESSKINCTKTSEISSESNETLSESSEKEPTPTVSSTDAAQISQKPENSEDSVSTCTSDGFYANPKDCKKFFRCVNNGKGGFAKYDFTCGEGTIWVQDIQACDHDNDNSTCSKQSGSTPSTTQTFGEQHYTTELTSTSYSDSEQEPNKENDEIPSDSAGAGSAVQSDRTQCNSEGFYSNEDDCSRFYRCVDNGKGGYTRYDFTCGEGTAWDSDIQACNHMSEVNSCKESNQQETSTKPVMHDEDMSQTTSSAPTDSTIKTSTSASSTENGKPASKDTCEQEGYFGNKEDCKKFYRCVDNGKGGLTKYDYTCGDGTIWDQDIITCNHPQDVTNPSCQSNDNSETLTSSTTSSSTSSSASQPTTTTTESSTNSSDCSQENSSTKPNNKVNCSKAGYFADPNDCKKFYRCVDWDGDGKRFSVYHFDCGEGTIWDPSLDTCNHEESVYPPRDCSGTQSQNGNVGQDSTTTEQTKTEEPTTQQSTTTDQTTTQESTTGEPVTAQQTTTQESTTSESTTALQTTSEQTTTQQTTSQQTDEQTTSQQTDAQTTAQETTGEQTTTTQPTTSEQTTTQQTTGEQTTTQQTTIEQTTTQITEESTTAQQTSTQETTTQQTTEQTTTQQSTDSESTTTQQSTNSEQTTTELSTSSDQTTTQQTSTESEQTTSTDNQQNTTEQTTTQDSSTEQQTNETTDESTSTTDESSTTENTQESTTSTQETTTDNGQDSTTESQQETTESSSSDKDCPDTDDDQNVFVCPTSFRRHPKYCNLFYQCTEDDDNQDVKVAVFHCPNNTIFDENKTKCVEEEKADKKCKGDIAERRRVKRLDTKYKEPVSS